jgi:ABC-type transport system involved in cytochrome bd biosynthesis fused ATPase/permease subunit
MTWFIIIMAVIILLFFVGSASKMGSHPPKKHSFRPYVGLLLVIVVAVWIAWANQDYFQTLVKMFK